MRGVLRGLLRGVLRIGIKRGIKRVIKRGIKKGIKMPCQKTKLLVAKCTNIFSSSRLNIFFSVKNYTFLMMISIPPGFMKKGLDPFKDKRYKVDV